MTNGVLQVSEMIKALGVNQGDHKGLLTFLVNNYSEFQEFVGKFYTGEVARDIIRYQRHKRAVNHLTLEEFLVLFKKDKKRALESLFQEPIRDHQVQYMVVYNLSPTELYKKYIKNSNESYLGVVKNTYEISSTFSDDTLLTT